MNRFCFYVDGFNLYHVIKRYHPNLKWLNIHQMLSSFIPKSAKVELVYYFSAYAEWIPERVVKHKKYVAALRTTDVKIILGKFKAKERKCKKCDFEYISHEEKQTDVNIALQVLDDAMQDKFDSAVIVSGDTDFLPIIRKIKTLFPEKRIGVLLPIGAHALSLKEEADFHFKLKVKHLKNNQFPEIIETKQGNIIIPDDWK